MRILSFLDQILFRFQLIELTLLSRLTFLIGFVSFDTVIEFFLSFSEEGMLKAMQVIFSGFAFKKGIEIQLSKKRSIVAMFEVSRQKQSTKLIRLMHNKGC